MAEWISVKRRLPQGAYEVLICSRGGVIAIGFFNDKNEWVNISHTFHSEITHWMPLPIPAVQ